MYNSLYAQGGEYGNILVYTLVTNYSRTNPLFNMINNQDITAKQIFY